MTDMAKDDAYSQAFLGWLESTERAKTDGKTILDYFEEHAKESPQHPCILYQDEVYSYADVAANVNRTARWINASDPGLKKGDVVCVLLHNGPTFVWTFLALLKLGVVASFINYNLKRAALLHSIRTSEANTLICGSEFLDIVEDILPELSEMNVGVWMISDAHTPGMILPASLDAMDITTVSGGHFPSIEIQDLETMACLVFTSGTTGMSKPAIVNHLKFLFGSLLYKLCAKPVQDDVHYITTPMYHILALCNGICGSIYNGVTMAIAKRFSASRFWDDVHTFNVTTFLYIGELCRYLLAQPKKENDGKYKRPLKAIIGNGLASDIWTEFQTRFKIGQIFEVYGTSEGNFTTINLDGHVGSVGKYPPMLKNRVDALQHTSEEIVSVAPLDENTLDMMEIVDYDNASGKPRRGRDGLCVQLPAGTAGLLLTKISEKSPFFGYKGHPELTEAKIVRDVKFLGDAFYNTGDLLKIDRDGYVFFVDRIGDTFRWKGENVSTQEVQNILNEFPAVLEANVYGIEVPGHEGRAGMAAIVPIGGTLIDFAAFYQHVTTSLPDYARPVFLRLVAKMEITATFKHKKADLVKRGFFPDDQSEVYIIQPSQKTYVAITPDHIRGLGRAKL